MALVDADYKFRWVNIGTQGVCSYYIIADDAFGRHEHLPHEALLQTGSCQ